MANNIKNLREDLKDLKYRNGLLENINCLKEDTEKYRQMVKNGEPLPDGIFQYKNEMGTPVDSFYTIYEADLSDEEKSEYFLLRQSSHIRTIKNCIVFLTVLAAIRLFFWVLSILTQLF